MQIARGATNPSWRWTDVRDDHLVERINRRTIGHDSPSNAIALAATTARPVLSWEGHTTRVATLILDDGPRAPVHRRANRVHSIAGGLPAGHRLLAEESPFRSLDAAVSSLPAPGGHPRDAAS